MVLIIRRASVKLVLIIIGLCLSILSQTAMAIVEQVDMKLILDKNDIKIWSYRLPDSPYHGFKAVTTLKSSLTGAVAMVMGENHANIGICWLGANIYGAPCKYKRSPVDSP